VFSLRDVSELHGGVDTQIDVSPYLNPEKEDGGKPPPSGHDFTGYKVSALSWKEDPNAKRVNLSVLSSGNQLFADNQLHNSDVFSIWDKFSYGDGTLHLQKCNASYFVFGWHSDESQDLLYNPTHQETLPDLLKKNHIHLVGADGIPLDESLLNERFPLPIVNRNQAMLL
jgi:hypothetical protein